MMGYRDFGDQVNMNRRSYFTYLYMDLRKLKTNIPAYIFLVLYMFYYRYSQVVVCQGCMKDVRLGAIICDTYTEMGGGCTY